MRCRRHVHRLGHTWRNRTLREGCSLRRLGRPPLRSVPVQRMRLAQLHPVTRGKSGVQMRCRRHAHRLGHNTGQTRVASGEPPSTVRAPSSVSYSVIDHALRSVGFNRVRCLLGSGGARAVVGHCVSEDAYAMPSPTSGSATDATRSWVIGASCISVRFASKCVRRANLACASIGR